MSEKLTVGQEITWDEGTKRYRGKVYVNWKNGAIGLVKISDDEFMTIKAELLGRPALHTRVGLDLAETEAIAVDILAGRPRSGSVSEELLKLATAFVALRHKAAA